MRARTLDAEGIGPAQSSGRPCRTEGDERIAAQSRRSRARLRPNCWNSPMDRESTRSETLRGGGALLARMRRRTAQTRSAAVDRAGRPTDLAPHRGVTLHVRPLSAAFIESYLDLDWEDCRWCVGCYRVEGPGRAAFSRALPAASSLCRACRFCRCSTICARALFWRHESEPALCRSDRRSDRAQQVAYHSQFLARASSALRRNTARRWSIPAHWRAVSLNRRADPDPARPATSPSPTKSPRSIMLDDPGSVARRARSARSTPSPARRADRSSVPTPMRAASSSRCCATSGPAAGRS